MGYSQTQKAENRERILALASAQIRAQGVQSLSVVPLMEAAGLTHGGFYGHFASRGALISAAIKRALDDGARVASRATGRSLTEIARSYLSRNHRDAPQLGCAIAAIGTDVARTDDESRAAMQTHIDAFIAGVRQFVPDDDCAALAVSAMVGALILARTYPDEQASDALLRAVRNGVAALGNGEGASDVALSSATDD